MTGQTTDLTERVAAPATRTNLVIGLLVGSAFVMILNETIMSVALPTLIVDLGIVTCSTSARTPGQSSAQ